MMGSFQGWDGQRLGLESQGWIQVIMIVCNNKMEKRTMQRKGEENSHGILHLICTSQDSDTFIRDLQSHKITEKCRVLEQRMHQNYKSTPSRHVSSFGKRAPKAPKHLVKHDNKIQANILLHQFDRFANNESKTPILKKINTKKLHSTHADSYFTPKTREEILRRHDIPHIDDGTLKKRKKNQSNFSIKMACEGGNSRISMDKPTPKYGRISFHNLQKEKENLMKYNTNMEVQLPSEFNSKSNSFLTFTNLSSHLYGKEKDELASLIDDQVPLRATQISGFTKHELFGYYKSLISFSKGGISRYLTGFQTMLNLMNISTNQNTIKQLLSSFILKPSFQQFMNVFVRIVESSLKESVVDYFQIVLDGKWGRQLCYDELIQLLSERMSNYHAKEIVEQLYFSLDKEADQKIAVQEIVGLCYQDEEFCSFMRGYCQETNRKRASQKPKSIF